MNKLQNQTSLQNQMNPKIEKPRNLVSLLNNHIWWAPTFASAEPLFFKPYGPKPNEQLVLINHLSLCDFHVGYNYKFIDPKSLRSINGKGLNGWPQTFAKRRVKVETFEHIQDVELSKLRRGQDMWRKIENFNKIRRECLRPFSTGLKNLKSVPLSHSDYNGSHWFF